MKLLFRFLAFIPAFAFSHEYLLSLGEFGSIRYTYDDEHLLQVERLSPSENVMYTHVYRYGLEGNLISESLIGDLGEIVYEDGIVRSPYSLENFAFDDEGTLIEHCYDGIFSKLTFDKTKLNVEYDSEGRVTQQGEKHFKYDDQHRLIEVSSPYCIVTYAYGPSGERISRTINGKTENYLYVGANEIAILDEQRQVKELRIPGLSFNKNIIRPIAIETQEAIYAPIHDIQGNIVKLVNISTREVINLSIPDAYGQGLSKDTPVSWIFLGKNYDRDTGLVCFGARYYSPDLKQWLTPDPAHQSLDQYEYCLGNPFAFVDSDGRWAVAVVRIAWGAGAAVTSPVWGPYALAAAGGMAIGYVGYEIYKEFREIKETKVEDEEPPFTWDELGDDPANCPGEGFVWKGNGPPGSGKGKWVRGPRGEQEELYPDLNHKDPIGPHWDYWGPKFPKGIRIKPDGTWELK